jgi:hypothetical protein
MAEPGAEFSRASGFGTEVVEEILAKLQFGQLALRDDEQERREGTVALSQRPADSERRVRVRLGTHQSSRPAIFGLSPLGVAHGSNSVPRVAASFEGSHYVGRRRIRKNQKRFHGPYVAL